MAQQQHLDRLPTLQHPFVFHVGTLLRPHDRPSRGLAVSLNPDDWAEAGSTGAVWIMSSWTSSHLWFIDLAAARDVLVDLRASETNPDHLLGDDLTMLTRLLHRHPDTGIDGIWMPGDQPHGLLLGPVCSYAVRATGKLHRPAPLPRHAA